MQYQMNFCEMQLITNKMNTLIMQRNNNSEKLCKYLISKGYDAAAISERNTSLYELELSLLEIKSGKYVIQTFVLMSNGVRNSRNRVPIYKTYTQETPKGNVIYPSCCIACFEDDTWHFYNASETCQPVRSSFVNYDNAKVNFAARLNLENKRQAIEILSKHSWILGCALLLFTVAYFIIARSLQLCNEVVILLILVITLFLLPDILRLVQKVSIKDIEFTINNGME